MTGVDGSAIGQTTTPGTNLLDLMNPLLLKHHLVRANEDLMQVALVSKRTNDIIPCATTYKNRAPGTNYSGLTYKSIHY